MSSSKVLFVLLVSLVIFVNIFLHFVCALFCHLLLSYMSLMAEHSHLLVSSCFVNIFCLFRPGLVLLMQILLDMRTAGDYLSPQHLCWCTRQCHQCHRCKLLSCYLNVFFCKLHPVPAEVAP